MKIIMKINKFNKGEEGSVLVIAVILMVVILGFTSMVLDYGLKYHAESRLQRALDSVALAAVRELPSNSNLSAEWSNVLTVAMKYADLNGVENFSTSNVLPVYESGKIIGVTVNGNTEIQYSFSRVFGVESAILNKKATAKLVKVSGVSGLLPLAIPKAVMEIIEQQGLMNQNITLKLGPQKISELEEDDMRDDFEVEFDIAGNNGWRGAINFISLSGSILPGGEYKTAMENGGFNSVVNIGDCVETNSGTMPVDVTGKIVIGQEATVPVIEKDASGVLRVVGFVTFKISNMEGNNPNAKKISILTSSYMSNYIVSGDSTSGVVLNDYGVRAAKLVDY
jgi:hypothetical protein